MRLDFVTIFPDYFAPLELSLLGKALDRGDLRFGVHDLRSWTDDVHRTVDDSPYGGGPGMIMKPEPWGRALRELTGETATAHRGPQLSPARIVMPTPAGRPFDQPLRRRPGRQPLADLLLRALRGHRCPRGRVARGAMDEISIGDYVLAGGEAAALVIVEAVARLLPGVLGNAAISG